MKILAIIALVLTVPIWRLYHKMFEVTYVGNAFKSILNELIISCVVSIFIVSLGAGLVKLVVGSLGRILLFILKVLLVGGGAALIIFLIVKLVNLIRGKHEDTGNVDNGIATETEPNTPMIGESDLQNGPETDGSAVQEESPASDGSSENAISDSTTDEVTAPEIEASLL